MKTGNIVFDRQLARWYDLIPHPEQIRLKEAVLKILTKPDANKIDELENNDSYAAAMARISYKRVAEKMPEIDNIEAMGRYWKKYYNTPLGKGTVKGYIELWDKMVGIKKIIIKKSCSK